MSEYEVVIRFKNRGLAERLLGRVNQWGYDVTQITSGFPDQYEVGEKENYIG